MSRLNQRSVPKTPRIQVNLVQKARCGNFPRVWEPLGSILNTRVARRRLGRILVINLDVPRCEWLDTVTTFPLFQGALLAYRKANMEKHYIHDILY